MATPKITKTKPPIQSVKLQHPPKVPTKLSKSSTSGKTPPVPHGILKKVFPPKPPPQQKEAKKIFGQSKFKNFSNFTTI